MICKDGICSGKNKCLSNFQIFTELGLKFERTTGHFEVW